MRKTQAALRSLGIGFSICALLLFGACGNPAGDGGEPSVPVAGVSIVPANPSVALGTTLQLQAVISPDNASDKTLVWTSSAPSIADVSATGLVIPYAVGSAVITAASADGPSGATKVTVTAASPAEGITLTGRGTIIGAGAVINMAAGDSLTVSAAVSPAGLDQTVTWVSGNPAVATAANGIINAAGAGDALITVSSAADPGKTVAFTVHVASAAIPVTGITLNSGVLNLTLGGADAALTVSYAPASATQTGVTWSSSNPAVATVANGVVHAAGAGTAVITAASTANSRITASATVNVIIPVTGIALDQSAMNIITGGADIALGVSYAPTNTTQTGITWSSNNPAVATAANGVVHAVAAGTAVITAASAANSAVTAVCAVTVTAPPPGISLSPNPLTINGVGTTGAFTVVYNPADAAQTGVTWSSNNASVAAVNPATGVITAMAAGSAVITATSAADPAKTASATVNVVIPVTGIALNQSALNLTAGGAGVTLAVTYVPANTTQTGITWSSSNPAVAAVSNGAVHAVSAGTAVITAASAVNNTVNSLCVVTVTAPLAGISLTPNPLTINGVGTTGSFTVVYNPATTAQTGVTWVSSNAAVAAVNSATGTITAASAGSAVISAISTADPAKTASATVNVIIPVTNITLNQTSLNLNPGGTGVLTTAYAPANTTQTGVTWSSSNPAVATVFNGTVTAVAAGSAVITATSAADPAKNASATVNVVNIVIPLTGIALNQTTLNLYKGETGDITVNYTPANTTQTGVTWSSNTPAVAAVSGGRVTAAGEGTATITATSTTGGYSASCAVTVTLPPLTGISLTPNPLVIGVGTTGSFAVSYIPAATVQTGVTWTSGDTTVATVDSDTGVITAAAVGTATITATSAVNPGISKTATVNVVIPVTGIALDKATLSLNKGETGALAVASYTPSDTTQRDVNWSSSNPAVATVVNGTVTAVGGGDATITATSAGNSAVKDSCAVTVTVPLTGISLSPNPLTITGLGSTGSFTVIYNPSDTTQKDVTWSSSNSAVATVSNGTVTAVAADSATITATSAVDGSKSGSATVTIIIPVTGITLDKTTLNLDKGGTAALAVNYTPANTTQTGVTWSSSNPAVATVSDGTVTAKAFGTAVITAASTADPTKTAACTVNVAVPVTGLSLPADFTLGVGNTYLLPVAYTPPDTTQRDVTWLSSNTAVATVSDDGKVTAKALGTAVITAASTANGGVSASCTVTVKASLNGAGVNIVFEGLEDETIELGPTVNQQDQLVITAPGGFDRYLWYMDHIIRGETSGPTNYFFSATPGRHYISVIVEEDGYHFSKTLIYTVGY
jgi:uncharacterized protein YjdB